MSVGDGAGARQALRQQTVDLLMTDVELPDGSGFDVAREALSQNPGLPVIFCSGHDVRDSARLFGPNAHLLRKPVDLHELEALVERLAQRAS